MGRSQWRRWRIVALLTVLLSALLSLGAAAPLAHAREREVAPPLKTYPVQGPSEEVVVRDTEEHISQQALRVEIADRTSADSRNLQPYKEATAHLPKDATGFPDWMKALREGLIKPRAGLAPNASMNVLDLDIVMKNTKEMPNVRFPHLSHTMWLDCSNCHPTPFEPKAGAASIKMADIFRGQFCGMCHDRVAFVTFFSCFRCHSVPQAAAKP